MAENDGDIVLQLTLEDGSVVTALASAEKQAKKTGDKIEKDLSKGLSNAFMGVGKAAAAGLAIAAAATVGIFTKGVAAAAVQEDAINDLNAALARTGQFTAAASQDFQDFASELQRNSTVGDEVILKNAAVLQSLGSLSNEGLKEATKAALDLSAALSIDLNSATVLVGKAATGEVGAFSRYGLAIQKGATNSETFANALLKINAQFGGAAAAKINTFSGATQQAANAFGDLLEEIGFLITKSPELTAIFRGNGTFIQDLSKRISDFRKSGGFRDLIFDAISFAKGINEFVVMPLEIVFNAFKAAISGVALLVQGVITGFNEVFALATSGINTVLGLFGKNIDSTAQLSRQIAEDSKDIFIQIAQETGEDFANIFETSGSDAASGFLSGLERIANEAPPLTEQIKNQLKQDIADIELSLASLARGIAAGFKPAQVSIENLSSSIRDKVTGGIGQAFASLGAAFAKGENGFAAFGKTMLGVLGDIAIQIGTILIAAGLGWSLIPGFQASAAAIPQGIALTVIGGALKAFSGSGGGSSASASASSGGGVTDQQLSLPGDVGPDAQLAQELEDQGPRVNLTVQGSVFNTRETGLELAQIISEAVGGNGVVFNT